MRTAIPLERSKLTAIRLNLTTKIALLIYDTGKALCIGLASVIISSTVVMSQRVQKRDFRKFTLKIEVMLIFSDGSNLIGFAPGVRAFETTLS